MNGNLDNDNDLHFSMLQSLYDIGIALTSEMQDFKILLNRVGESARSVLGAAVAACYAYDHKTGTYELAADTGEKFAPTLTRVPSPDGPTALIVRTGSPLISNDAQNDDTPFRTSPFTQTEGVQSVIGLPLKKGEVIVGVLYINYRDPGMITPEVRYYAELLANQAATAIYNARVYRQLAERETALAQLVEKIHQMSEAIAKQHPETKSTIKLILDEIAKASGHLVRADCAVIYPYDASRGQFYEIGNIGTWGIEKDFEITDRPRPSGGMAALVRREKMVIYEDIALDNPEMLERSVIKREKIRAFMGIAIEAAGVDLGVLYVNFRKPHGFSSQEIEIAKLFANQAGVILQTGRVLEREQKARIALETLDLWNHIGAVFIHRAHNVIGTIPIASEQIRTEMSKLQIQNQDIDQWLDRLETDVGRLRDIVDRFKKISELEGIPELTNINSILQSIVRGNAPSSVHVTEHYAPDLQITYVPKPQVTEVFENIVKNAIDAMPEGGELTIETKLADQNFIEVDISDTGDGIDQSAKEKIFELFYSGKKDGMGFGLWWSRTFIRRIGGDISVESERGEGSTFRVNVPLVQQDYERYTNRSGL